MAYFPFFMDIKEKNVLIVGGGSVALRKAEKLLPYGPKLRIVAEEISEAFSVLPAQDRIELIKASFTEASLNDADFVIAATDNPSVNAAVSAHCRARGIPCNVVDDKERCDFLFPTLLLSEPLSIGISTGGASPSAAIDLKERIKALLPENYGALLSYLEGLRPYIKSRIPEERARAAAHKRVYDTCMKDGWPLSDEQLEAVIMSRK